MKLTEMLGQYEELLDKKDQLAKDTKDNNAAIDKLKAEIAEKMNRSESSIKYKLYGREKSDGRS